MADRRAATWFNKNLIINDKDLKELQDNNNKEITYGQENVGSGFVPAYRFRPHQTNKAIKAGADGVDLHTGGAINDTSTWSMGCLTVAEDEYYQFGVTAGFIDVQSDPSKYTTYNSFVDYGLITYKELEHWGYTVVNREYMNQTDRRTFLPDYEDEKIN